MPVGADTGLEGVRGPWVLRLDQVLLPFTPSSSALPVDLRCLLALERAQATCCSPLRPALGLTAPASHSPLQAYSVLQATHLQPICLSGFRKSLHAALLESRILPPPSRLFPAPTTTDLLFYYPLWPVGLLAVLGTRLMLLPLFTLFPIPKTTSPSLSTHLILYYILYHHLHHFHLRISIAPSTTIKNFSKTPPSLPSPPPSPLGSLHHQHCSQHH